MPAGSNGTAPVPVTKIENVGVAPAVIEVVTLAAGADRHAPVTGLLSQIDSARGKIAVPVSADAVIESWLPTLTVATAKAFAPELPGKSTMPSPVGVAARATISGTGVLEADSNSVFKPTVTGAGFVLKQSKVSCTSVESKAAVGVKANT